MLAIIGRETARFGAGLAGALVFAAALAALGVRGATGGVVLYLGTVFTRIWDGLSLDFGTSTIGGASALSEIALPLAASFSLLLPGLVLAVVFGVPLGLVLADKKTNPFAAPLILFGRSVPVFCGALLIAVAAAALVPGSVPGRDVTFSIAWGAGDAAATLANAAALAPLVLPIAFAGAGAIAAAVGGAMDEALSESYRESLRRLGLAEREILRTYVTRRALARAMVALGDVVLVTIAALAVVERLFDWQGAGAQFIQAAALHDWAVVAALVFVIAVVRIVADFAGVLAATILTGTSR